MRVARLLVDRGLPLLEVCSLPIEGVSHVGRETEYCLVNLLFVW